MARGPAGWGQFHSPSSHRHAARASLGMPVTQPETPGQVGGRGRSDDGGDRETQ